jgi:hypothetical protein
MYFFLKKIDEVFQSSDTEIVDGLLVLLASDPDSLRVGSGTFSVQDLCPISVVFNF